MTNVVLKQWSKAAHEAELKYREQKAKEIAAKREAIRAKMKKSK